MEESKDPHEILRISCEQMSDGLVYIRQVSFASTGEVFTRLARREDDDEMPWETKGWTPGGKWKNMEQLYLKAEYAKKFGCVIEWAVEYSPGLREFTKSMKL